MSNKQRIYSWADANASIGYGHFIRTLALADMLKDDFDCTLFTQSPSVFQRKEVEGVCKMIALPDGDNRFKIFLDELQGKEVVVLDNYFFTTEYQKQIKAKGCTLVCIDDMHDKHYVADVVINHGCYDSTLFSVEPYTKLCLGLDWALLRKPFLVAAKEQKYRTYNDTIKTVAVCFGGADPLHLTEKVLFQLNNMPDIIQVHAIVGTHFGKIGQNTNSKVSFYQSISAQQVAAIFSLSDLSIVSLSTVCLEALACGAKVAAGWYADNQKEGYDTFLEKGFILGLGDLRNVKSPLVDPSVFCDNTLKVNRLKFNSAIKERYIRFFKKMV